MDNESTIFIPVDRSTLRKLGYQNTWKQVKDVKGISKQDNDGKPKMIDNRNDFANFTLFLRKHSDKFIEGTSFENVQVHYIIKTCTESFTRGKKRNDIWVRKDVLEQCLQNANFIVRKYIEHGIVYFIHEENKFNRFKVGFTRNLAKRLVALQIGNPDVLVVYRSIENVSVQKEHELHQFFANYHIRGEWYSITTDMIDSIDH